MPISAGLVALVPVVVTRAGGWFITTKVTDRWDSIKKRRDMDLAAAQEFQRHYGDFLAIWKLWDSAMKLATKAQPSEDRVWECLRLAAATEGGIEALRARTASQRCLSDDEIDALGRGPPGVPDLTQGHTRTERAQLALVGHARLLGT